MNFRTSFAAAVVAVATATTATPAAAAIFVLNGNTTGAPTYNRPLAGNPPTGLSGVGTAVAYRTLTFTVDITGTYSVVQASNTAAYDPFLGLYSGTFNPNAPLTNALVYNDDLGGSLTQSGFSRALTAGTSYTAVMTGFDNLDFGAFTLTIDGQGVVTPSAAGAVPEPATWAMMMLGFGLMGGALRRRATVSKVTYATT